MPWTHCDAEIIDSDPCPGCGLTKAEWTIEVDKTRMFTVARTKRTKKKKDAWIEVQLLDAGGDPLAGAAYRIALPSGRVREGSADDEGRVRLEEISAGPCEVDFPNYLDEALERETGEVHVIELVAASLRFSF